MVERVAKVRANSEKATTSLLGKRLSSATGSQMVSPNMTTVAQVTAMPMNENRAMVVGSPTSCPNI